MQKWVTTSKPAPPHSSSPPPTPPPSLSRDSPPSSTPPSSSSSPSSQDTHQHASNTIPLLKNHEDSDKASSGTTSSRQQNTSGTIGGADSVPAATQQRKSSSSNSTNNIRHLTASSSSTSLASKHTLNNTGVLPGAPADKSSLYSFIDDIIENMSDKDEEEDNRTASLKEEVAELRDELGTAKATIQELRKREKTMRDRLSEQALRQLESSSKFEDLNLGVNRPTQLIRRYGNLYTETRLDAFDALDELPEMSEFDELKGKLLFCVIVLAFRSVQNSLHTIKAKLSRVLYFPAPWGHQTAMNPSEPSPSTSSDNVDPVVRDLQDAVGVYLRKTVDKQDVSSNVKEVCEQVWKTLYDYPSLKACSSLEDYIREAVKIAWALTVQTPGYSLDYDSGTFCSDKHTRFHSSDPDSDVIRHVLWPALLEGADKVCVYKAVVIT